MKAKLMLWIFMIASIWWTCKSLPSSQFLRTVVDYGAPTPSRICGPNGHCAEVTDGLYYDGNPITLQPCKSNSDDVNQLWTYLSDGTILSNRMCLTAAGYSQSNNVTIYDSHTVAIGRTIWEIEDNGLIVNVKSGLVLKAITAAVGTHLTLEANIHSSFQTWRVEANTEPVRASIIGYLDLCLQETDNSVWMAKCENHTVEQQWLIYPDKTIRPQQNPSGCLSYENMNYDDLILQQLGF